MAILHALGGRVIRPELLDDQAPEDSRKSLGDLVRINRYLGGHKVLLGSLRKLFKPAERFSFLDVGAASGDMARTLRRHFPNASTVCLDYREHHLKHAPPPAIVGNAFMPPMRDKSFDVVYCSLFLHHFEDRQVTQLLTKFGGLARRYVICSDLQRHPLSYYFLPATKWLFRWDALTLHDGPISVEAGFRSSELRLLAEQAGLQQVEIEAFYPSFRLSLVAKPASSPAD